MYERPLTVDVEEMGPHVEEILERYGDIKFKFPLIKAYGLILHPEGKTPEERNSSYEWLKTELSKEKYVKQVEEPGTIELLSAIA